MFNDEWRVTVSTSGGAGVGGTIERGLTIAHDPQKAWYKGWSIGLFKTEGVGAYTNIDASSEINVGWSRNSSIFALSGTSVTSGGSAGTIVDLGYEFAISNTAKVLHNYSLGISTPSPVPFEVHSYKTETTILKSFNW